ncbi:hypothetical protein BU14_0033s0070 [Porphyra umbilicalis]|uniref:BZIP domain-containing protein n=1 Tax=Porphyra umbilicalis TaxID=2786 RepID=A0A1X6PJ02_PORUM|nr:hypothetical protein BU14_0033s0070 [Porphyra umbilicalis]|eukprot:OSX80726.1 hypothetical protein BU14_0033s0070 [Porphyra umbilicalis]
MANACAATTKALCHEDPAEYYYVPRGNGGGGGGAGARVGTAPVAISPAMAPATPLSGGSYGSPLDATSPPSYMLGYATGGPSPPPPMSHAHGRVMSSDALAELAVLRDRAVAEACRDGIWQARLGRRRAPHGAPAPVGVAGGEELIFGAPDGLDDGMLSAFHAAALDVPGEGMSASMEAALADAAAAAAVAPATGLTSTATLSVALPPPPPLAQSAMPAKVVAEPAQPLVSTPPPDVSVVSAPEPVSQPPTPILADLPRGGAAAAAGVGVGIKRRLPGASLPALPVPPAAHDPRGRSAHSGRLLSAAAVKLRQAIPTATIGAAPPPLPQKARGRRSSAASSSAASGCGSASSGRASAVGSMGCDSGAVGVSRSAPRSGVASSAVSSLCDSQERAVKRSRIAGAGLASAAAVASPAAAAIVTAPASVDVKPVACRTGGTASVATSMGGARSAPLNGASLGDLTGTTAAESRRMTADQHALMLHKRKLRNRASAARSRDRQRASASATGCEVGRLRAEAAASATVAAAAVADANALRADNGRLRAELARVSALLASATAAAEATKSAATAAAAAAAAAASATVSLGVGAAAGGSRPPTGRVATLVDSGTTTAPTAAARAPEATGLLRRPSSVALLKHVSSLERLLDVLHASGAAAPFGISRSHSIVKSC